MKILFIHANKISWKAKEKALKSLSEEIGEKEGCVENCLVCFSCIEEGDINKINEIISNIEDVAQKIKVNTIVIYPFVHLFPEKLASIEECKKVLIHLVERLKNKEYNIYLVRFGYYKEFNLHCKGHPLAELSRKI